MRISDWSSDVCTSDLTILNMRAPGMSLMKMPMFVWTWLITAFLLIAIMPVLAGAVTMMLADRHFGTSFFEAAGGGDPILFQPVFWFFCLPSSSERRVGKGCVRTCSFRWWPDY